MSPTISIIIPVLNEEAIIRQTVERLQVNPEVEIIVVDGGSRDRTFVVAKQMQVLTIAAQPNRASQMNAGAAVATGDILLFLHADTQLPAKFIKLIRQTLSQPKVIAGAFELAIEGESKALRLVEAMVKLRSHFLSLPYGDQAIFISKKNFIAFGGFADMPIMEDFEFVNRLKRQGKLAIAPAAVITSGRRWQKLGIFKTTLINQLVIVGYYLGISPTKLKTFYRSADREKNKY